MEEIHGIEVVEIRAAPHVVTFSSSGSVDPKRSAVGENKQRSLENVPVRSVAAPYINHIACKGLPPRIFVVPL